MPPRSPQMPLPGPSTGSKRGLEFSDERQQNEAKRPRVDAADTLTRRKMVTIKLPRCKRCQNAHIGGCDGNVATVANETLQSDSLEAIQSHEADSPYQEPQGHKVDLEMSVTGKSEDDLSELFDSVIAPIIQNALCHKLQLVANGCKCAYFWPCDGGKSKGNKMKEFGAQTTNTLAARTIFPGLDFDLPPSCDYPLHPIITSLVMTKKDPSRAQAS